jgi:hypothetical protein
MRPSSRVTLWICVVMAAVLVTGGAAAAKGPMVVEAAITGPGIETPIVFSDPDGEMGINNTPDSERLSLFIQQTGIHDSVYGRKGVTSREPRGRLGPRFTVTWTLAFVIGHEGSVQDLGEFTSHLYPYAEEGPVIFTSGTEVGEPQAAMTIDAAWSHAPGVLLENLQAWGIPRPQDASPRDGGVGDATAATASETLWSWLIPVLLAVAIATAFRLVSRKRRIAH